jgi:hypothetical protein
MKGFVLFTLLLIISFFGEGQELSSKIYLKTPGNLADEYSLDWKKTSDKSWELSSASMDDINIVVEKDDDIYRFYIEAINNINFNLQNFYLTKYEYSESQFLMPGLWYKKNKRSSPGSPTVNESQNWSFREDRLSTPLVGVHNKTKNEGLSILRLDKISNDSLAVPNYGDIILTNHTDLGSLGFGDKSGYVYLQFGYPYLEAPKTYVRKLELAPESTAFLTLEKGQKIKLTYQIRIKSIDSYANYVKDIWQYSFDTLKPEKLTDTLSTKTVKSTLAKFFKQSYVNESDLKGFSGVHITTKNAEKRDVLEVGFIGRNLLNAFNALEYGSKVNDEELVNIGKSVFESYINFGFDDNGFLREYVDNTKSSHSKNEDVLSIRRQSEGAYAALLYMLDKKRSGLSTGDWDNKIIKLLDNILRLQRDNGSFPRKYTSEFEIIDKSGGSSASAILPLTMAYKYFDNPDYLISAEKAASYLENTIVSKSDYFSSTLDANSVDKEASFYAATAFYYLSLATQDKANSSKYVKLAEQANYFVMSWYYTWDVPFSKGQMLGDVGFKTRGWGNVSVENNHVDVFIFGYLDVLNWISKSNGDKRLSAFAEVIESSMKSQLLPRKGHMFNIGKEGYHPEVVQHTNWDYGHFGKGFYNDIFAPGWVVASLWEMLTPKRAESFFNENLHN